MQVIIRDDDIHYFTPPDRLETLYAPCWERGIPVCLSVVPLIRSRADKTSLLPIAENQALCAFLNDALREDKVEIVLHGYAHDHGEYADDDRATLARLFEEGLALLQKAFPQAEIRTFVPPHERLSTQARDFLVERGFNICTTSASLLAPGKLGWLLFALKWGVGWPGFRVIHKGRSRLFTCDQYLFAPRSWSEARVRRAVRFCQRKNVPLICANHHWHFFDGEGRPQALLRRWHSFIAGLVEREEVSFTTFNAYR